MSSATTTTRRLRAFKRWMKSQGIDCSDALELTDGEEGIAVRAFCDLKEGELVATIPKNACLSIKTSAAREMIEEAGLADSLGLSVAVMYERSLGEASKWFGYLQLLPDRESVPLVWTLDEVDRFLAGTELHKIVKEDKTIIYEDWKECILPLMDLEQLKINPNSFAVEQYFAAKSLVSSRSFEIDDYHGSGMVPLADLFNHKTGDENVHFTSPSSDSSSENESDEEEENHNEDYDNHNKLSDEDIAAVRINSPAALAEDNATDSGDPAALEMIIVKGVITGDEVFNTYGSNGNAALLHRYGFTELDNPFDIVNIDLSLVLGWSSSLFSSRYSRARVSLWRRLDCSGCVSQDSEYFEVSSDGQPQLELLILLYVIFLSEEAYNKLDHTLTSSVGNINTSINVLLFDKFKIRPLKTPEMAKEFLFTSEVRKGIVSIADIREKLYGMNSLEDDVKALQNCCMKERKLYHSLVLRVSERRIIQKLRTYASNSCRPKKRSFGSRCKT
ncbi:hypothetical protein GIB67_041358 [Kingdonia uniflora]|uniref:N-lysine methyltransferase n=1 Tax=Kingdonia uniflora TaxID=39325 RepID=A0A7J7NJ35_9MAGN|nr:hypothetical protein GIB67_041358 [Kingdonia uniflora]